MKAYWPLLTFSLCLVICGHDAFAAEKSAEIKSPPFFSGTIRANFPGQNTTMKGIVVTLSQNPNAYVCFDTDLLRVSLGWTGDYLKFGNYMKEINHPQPPEVAGTPAFGTTPGPGWAKAGSFADTRPRHQGPLPADWSSYRGLYLYQDKVVFSYRVGDCEILEMPGVESHDGTFAFTRTLNVGESKEPLIVRACNRPRSPSTNSLSLVHNESQFHFIVAGPTDGARIAVGILGGAEDLSFHGSRTKATPLGSEEILVKIPAARKPTRLKLVIEQIQSEEALVRFRNHLRRSQQPTDLALLCQGGLARWPEPVVTKGTLGTNGPYAVDTLSEPVPNPWDTKTFFGGFDFFPDGRAAICTFHGDVWIVSGIDANLGNLTWKRFATGLFQPLGLKIVDGKIYVTGRDQITRLHDLNHDGEADFYENFNNESVVTANYHEFSLDLQTDSHGNFYYAKASPWSPNVDSPHQGTILKVSKDGSKLEVFATGLRAPNGMGIGPGDEITVSDNEGHWMPAAKLNLVRKGGFYGMMPAAQHELTLKRGGTNFVVNPSDPAARAALKFAAFDAAAPMPEAYDEPICWLPKNIDNSSGGQVWVTSDQWGPFKNHMLFTSFGKCALFHVMTQEVDGQTQAAMVRFPFKFKSGVMRVRFNPRDGQLYLCGLRGWQTDATRDGGFYRVRFTGAPVQMPLDMQVMRKGVRITFTSPLDTASASDAANWAIEQWNYVWSGTYGSPEMSPSDPPKKGHDRMEVKSVQLSADQRTVFLEIPEIKPVDQMKIKFNIKAADGSSVAHEIYNTIHRLGAEKQLSAK
jgi:hypothetical protein